MKKVHTSAVIIAPPEELWGQIQNIRREHDKAFSRWPPHVNLIYPFVPVEKFNDAVSKIQSKISAIQPFTITFSKMGHFAHGKQSTLFLDASHDEIKELQSAILGAFPHCDDLNTMSPGGFHGHLTLGQFPTQDIQNIISKFSSQWSPITFSVDNIQLIARPSSGKEPFKTVHTIPIITKRDEDDIVHEEAENTNWDSTNDTWEPNSNGNWDENVEDWGVDESNWARDTGAPDKDIELSEDDLRIIAKLASAQNEPRKHYKKIKKPIYTISRTCKECNAAIFQFEPSSLKQDKYFKIKESIAIHKHKFSAHSEEKSLSSLIDLSVQFAKSHKRRRATKQFEVFLRWVKGENWEHYDRFVILLMNRLRQEQKGSKDVREKVVLMQSWKTKEKEQHEKAVPI